MNEGLTVRDREDELMVFLDRAEGILHARQHDSFPGAPSGHSRKLSFVWFNQ
jgi:hypothetical protein